MKKTIILFSLLLASLLSISQAPVILTLNGQLSGDTNLIPNFYQKVRAVQSAGGGSNVGDSLKRNTDSIAAHNSRIIANTTALSAARDSVSNIMNFQQIPATGIVYNIGDVLTFFGDSYIQGLGVTNALFRWTTLLCSYLNVTEDNRGIATTTLENQAPVQVNNMISLISTIPLKSATSKGVVFAYGYNDEGINSSNYNPVNFKASYDTIISYAINTKKRLPQELYIVSPYLITSAGRTAYNGVFGNGIPSIARCDSFYIAAKEVARKWGVVFIDVQAGQKLNGDTTLFAADKIHPIDSGYYNIAKIAYQYFAASASQVGGRVTVLNSTLTGGLSTNATHIRYGRSGEIYNLTASNDIVFTNNFINTPSGNKYINTGAAGYIYFDASGNTTINNVASGSAGASLNATKTWTFAIGGATTLPGALTVPAGFDINSSGTRFSNIYGINANFNGGIYTGYLAVTSAYTATLADGNINATSGTFNVTLPSASTCTGRNYTIKNSGAGSITVATTSSQTIDGSTTYSLASQYKYVTIQSTGANWIVIANN